MKKKFTLSLVFIGYLISLLLVIGCSDKLEKSDDNTNIKKVEIEFYMLGDEPRDMPLIEGEINKLTIEDLNCNVDFNFTTWSDYKQRYNLLLTSGQPINLIFTSEWLNFNQYAYKGAFLELEDLLPVFAPDLFKFVPEEYWEAIKINGHIYTIPSVWTEYVNEGFLYREDLRKKYRLPIPDSLQNIEKYLEGIKKFEPDRNLTSELVIDNGFGPFFSAASVLYIKYNWVDFGMPYGLVADYDDPDEISFYWESPEFIEDMKMFKRWAEKGFWSKSALSNSNAINDAFISDYSIAVMSGLNPVKYNRTATLIGSKFPEYEVGYFPYCRSTGLVKPVHPTHNGFAIPINAKNPERALMFYEKLVLDKTYHSLTQYGIEGEHYYIDDDGYYQMIGDLNSNGFSREAMNSWAWRNPELMLFDRHFDTVQKLFDEFDEYAQPDIFFSFVEDYTPYQVERAALYQVQSQYLVPIQAGMVKDVEKAIGEFLKKANTAGLEVIHEEYKRQWAAYCLEKGLD